MQNNLAAFERLINIMNELRAKCPWDKKQTLQSLSNLTIEEVYELTDAILNNDYEEIAGELGDLFLHLVFYAKIGTELEKFTLESILNRVCDKLIERHPHIYGDVKVKDEEEVKRNWQKIKSNEGKIDKSILEGVPKSLPAIVKAARIQEKAKQVGFEWENKADVWKKVDEEIRELQDAEKSACQEDIEAEFGDVLFSLINYARFLQIDPEAALEKTNQKFIQRFKAMEEIALSKGVQSTDLSLVQMDELWNSVKRKN